MEAQDLTAVLHQQDFIPVGIPDVETDIFLWPIKKCLLFKILTLPCVLIINQRFTMPIKTTFVIVP